MSIKKLFENNITLHISDSITFISSFEQVKRLVMVLKNVENKEVLERWEFSVSYNYKTK